MIPPRPFPPREDTWHTYRIPELPKSQRLGTEAAISGTIDHVHIHCGGYESSTRSSTDTCFALVPNTGQSEAGGFEADKDGSIAVESSAGGLRARMGVAYANSA